jgi:hypothetical protein
MNISYAYLHCKPDGTPFYVGKGVRSRYKNFTYRNQYHKRVVAKYGQENILIGKIECSTNEVALELEVGLIKCLKRMGRPLTNITEGGEGNVGWECPDQVKQAVAEANKRRIWTQEQKYKLGSLHRGKKRPDHSQKMKEKGLWKKEKNPGFNAGYKQTGDKNHMARSVIGSHPEKGVSVWCTLKEASEVIGVSIQAICRALKKGHKSKGWVLGYAP